MPDERPDIVRQALAAEVAELRRRLKQQGAEETKLAKQLVALTRELEGAQRSITASERDTDELNAKIAKLQVGQGQKTEHQNRELKRLQLSNDSIGEKLNTATLQRDECRTRLHHVYQLRWTQLGSVLRETMRTPTSVWKLPFRVARIVFRS